MSASFDFAYATLRTNGNGVSVRESILDVSIVQRFLEDVLNNASVHPERSKATSPVHTERSDATSSVHPKRSKALRSS